MLLLIVGLLFFAGSIYNIFISNDFNDAIYGFGISTFLICAYFYKVRESKKTEAFIKWLEDNKEEIYRGQAHYNGIRILPETELVQFETCISVLVATFRIPSGFYIKGYHSIVVMGAIHSIITLMFGFWGLPWGPIYTVKTLFSNLKGGTRLQVKSIIPFDSEQKIFKD